MNFEQYLAEVRAGSGVHEAAELDLIEELRGHLEDAAQELQLSGMRRQESEREAMRRLGCPEVIATAFRRERRRSSHHPRVLLAAAALAASLIGSAAVSAAHYQQPTAPTVPAANHAQAHR